MNIILGITGGIAAYKSQLLIRLFVSNGHAVKVIATQNALQFVTALTLETLSQNKVYADTFAEKSSFSVDHVALAEWADAVVIAPATANMLAKVNCGIADDALSTFLVAAHHKPIFFAPAMNNNMWQNPTVQKNITQLKENGTQFVAPESGFLACGTSGDGRMAEPQTIFNAVINSLNSEKSWKGKTVLITAGPTHEPIDPVRFIGNSSSGLMGYMLAETFAENGAEVILVSGPSSLSVAHKNIILREVTTANEMFAEVKKHTDSFHVAIMAAAVADYTPKVVADQKIKKNDDELILTLQKNPDILAYVGANKKEGQCVVGFALETNNEFENAQSKLERKKCDMLVLNKMSDEGAGFNTPTNHVYLLSPHFLTEEIPLQSKKNIAEKIRLKITSLLSNIES